MYRDQREDSNLRITSRPIMMSSFARDYVYFLLTAAEEGMKA